MMTAGMWFGAFVGMFCVGSVFALQHYLKVTDLHRRMKRDFGYTMKEKYYYKLLEERENKKKDGRHWLAP